MDLTWVRIQSWHALKTTDRTCCGRPVAPESVQSTTLPAEKSCETCLRIVARRADG